MESIKGVTIGTFAAWLIIFFIVGGMWGCPTYRVWQQEKEGEAERARADQNRQITITEAIAKNEAATSNALAKIKISEAEAQAEIIRAKGAAEANKIISSTLTESYLRYRWIEGLQTNQMQVVYVPTEGNLPILEAGKR
jgi:regulator of protease activity HflC (stomatin/prohibitin superfamily)